MAVELSQPFFAQDFTQSSEILGENSQKSTDIPSVSNALLHELQLGEKLNESVVADRRADFSLMLAMLAKDVREQSQFILPKSPFSEPAKLSNSELRKQFHLPKEAPLSLSTLNELEQFNQAKSIEEGHLASLHLTNALNPKPLAFRDDKQHIELTVMQNTSLSCQLKYQQAIAERLNNHDKPEDEPLTKPLSFNAKAWLDGIQQSIVKAPLIN